MYFILQILPPGYPCEVIGAATPVNVTACRHVPDCSGAEVARFRSIDGTCNNLARDVSWGSTGEVFSRLVKRSASIRRMVDKACTRLRDKMSRRSLAQG